MKEMMFEAVQMIVMCLAPVVAGLLVWALQRLAKKLGVQATAEVQHMVQRCAYLAVAAVEKLALNAVAIEGGPKWSSKEKAQKALEIALELTKGKIPAKDLEIAIEAAVLGMNRG